MDQRPSCAGEATAPVSGGSAAGPAGAPALGATRLQVAGAIFDADDVLYDATLWPRKLLRLLVRLGISISYGELVTAWQQNYLVDVDCGRRDYDEAFGSFLLALGLSWAQIDEVEAASRLERHSLELGVRPLPGVVPTLTRLRQRGLVMAAWADAPHPACELSARLERLGLRSAFRHVLTSFDVEAAQPAPRSYEAALAALGLPAASVAYVGHDALHLRGARSAGLRSVAFNFQEGAEAEFYATAFEDLLQLFGEGPPESDHREPASQAAPVRPQVVPRAGADDAPRGLFEQPTAG